jgi:hypothetical protein
MRREFVARIGRTRTPLCDGSFTCVTATQTFYDFLSPLPEGLRYFLNNDTIHSLFPTGCMTQKM